MSNSSSLNPSGYYLNTGIWSKGNLMLSQSSIWKIVYIWFCTSHAWKYAERVGDVSTSLALWALELVGGWCLWGNAYHSVPFSKVRDWSHLLCSNVVTSIILLKLRTMMDPPSLNTWFKSDPTVLKPRSQGGEWLNKLGKMSGGTKRRAQGITESGHNCGAAGRRAKTMSSELVSVRGLPETVDPLRCMRKWRTKAK